MKKIFLFLFAFASLYVKSQTTCQGAQPFCAGGSSGITFPTTIGNPSSPTGPDYDCLLTTPNAAWYYLQINASGNLDVLIQGQTATGGAGQDVDFVCWGPFSNLTNVCSNLNGNVVDCSYSSSYTETLNIPNGVTGQYYMVLITNFANVPQNIVFNQQSGSGNTNCTLLQTNNSSICSGSSATVTASNTGNLSTPNYSLNPGGFTNNTGTFVVFPPTSTIYTVYVTGLNASSVVVTQTAIASVTVNPQPVVAPTTTQTSCTSTLSAFNFNLSFIPGGTPGYTVNWAGVPGGITASSQTSLSGNITSGAYAATVTAAGGCTVGVNFTLAPQPAQANYTLNPFGSSFSVTCGHPSIDIYATQPSFSYTWTNGTGSPVNNDAVLFTTSNLGTWTITGVNPASGCIATHTFTVGQNFVAPTAVVTPTNQVINCTNLSPQTVSATASPTANITHYFYAPSGGTVSAASYTAIYVPGEPGTYTHCIVNNVNGCSSCRNFTVATSDAYPSISITSSVSNVPSFTLGCSTKSVALVRVDGQSNPIGGSATFTLLPPGYTGTYGYSSNTSYNVTTPGIWTAVVKNPSPSFCETKTQFSIIQDIEGPDIHADVPVSILSCDTRSTILTAVTSNTNVQFTWLYTGVPGSQTSPTIAVNTTTNTQSSSVDTYTLRLMDNNNLCISTLTVPIRQNLYPPKAGISGGATLSITCNAPTVNFISTSTTTIPAGSGLPTNSFVVASLWEGPSPQLPLQLSTSYVGAVAGTYTLTVKDLNNGCTSQTTALLADGKNYPVVNNPTGPGNFTLDCGSNNIKIYTFITSSVTNLTYLWTAPLQASTSPVAGASLTTNAPGLYKILVTNNISGCKTTGEALVVPGNLNASFSADHSSGYAPLNVTFQNNSNSSLNTESITTVWSFGNGTNMTTNSASLTANAVYSQPGTYTVTAYVNKGACQDTAVRVIHVDIPSKIEVPNVFTPNGDGVNDLFFLKVANLTDVTALIFDRWGHKVYELTSSTGNIAWDGKNEFGKEVAAGTYFFIIKATGRDGQTYDQKGTVNLYR